MISQYKQVGQVVRHSMTRIPISPCLGLYIELYTGIRLLSFYFQFCNICSYDDCSRLAVREVAIITNCSNVDL